MPAVPRWPRLFALAALVYPRLVPVRLRWKSASLGLGLVVSRLTASEGASPGDLLHGIGLEQGRALRRDLGYGRDPLECARAVALANRVYAIDARVVATSSQEARVVTPGCSWSRQNWWGARPCSAFSRWEQGMVAGLNDRVELRYESKRTRGDDRCVGVYRWRAAGEGEDS